MTRGAWIKRGLGQRKPHITKWGNLWRCEMMHRYDRCGATPVRAYLNWAERN